MSTSLSQPLQIHQFHAKASAGDAITQHMLFIQEALEEIGIGGKIFAKDIKNLPQGKVLPWSLDSAWDCDLFLIHHSQYNSEFKAVTSLEIPKAVVYHSQPPETYFAHDLDLKKALHRGKKQLVGYKRKKIPALGVSSFSINELESLGFARPQKLPLLHLPLPGKRQKEWDWAEPKYLIFVGRLAPHKKQSYLVETFYHLKKLFPARSKLYLLGTGDPLYTKYLKLLIQQWGLENHVILTGKVTDSELVKYYSLADAFVCASEHEGFCLPLVEAMKFGVPVFFRSCLGVQETMGGSGVELLGTQASETAAVIQSLMKNPAALEKTVEKQDDRLRQLSLFQNRKNLQKILFSLCMEQRKINFQTSRLKLKSPLHETSIAF